MKEEVYERYIQAGKAASEILKKGAGLISAGVSILEVGTKVEEMVLDRGFGIAFPVNISLNETAAHDTPSPDDIRVFNNGDIVKLDLGVHLDGYIADTACSVDLGDKPELLKASSAALREAISAVKPGVTIGALGTIVAREIVSRGFKPIANLTGHGLDRFCLHMGPNVPNIPMTGGAVIEEEMVLAIEPFATTGTGYVRDTSRNEIYSQLVNRPVRLSTERKIMSEIGDRKSMPFARRHLKVKKPELALSHLVHEGVLRSYPVLSDVAGSFVSQFEHTLIVTSDGCEITTE